MADKINVSGIRRGSYHNSPGGNFSKTPEIRPYILDFPFRSCFNHVIEPVFPDIPGPDAKSIRKAGGCRCGLVRLVRKVHGDPVAVQFCCERAALHEETGTLSGAQVPLLPQDVGRCKRGIPQSSTSIQGVNQRRSNPSCSVTINAFRTGQSPVPLPESTINPPALRACRRRRGFLNPAFP